MQARKTRSRQCRPERIVESATESGRATRISVATNASVPRSRVSRSLGSMRRREHDEQDREQDHAQVLLELDHVLDVHLALVGEQDAEHGHGQQSGLVLNQVRRDEGDKDDDERDRALQPIGNPVAPEDEQEPARSDPAERGAGDGRLQQAHDDRPGGLFEPSDEDGLVDQHGQQRTDRVVQDSLPTSRSNPRRGSGRTNRSSGPTTVGPETVSSAPIRIARFSGRSSSQTAAAVPTIHVTATPIVINWTMVAPGLAQLGDVERQAALEQQDRDAQRDDREQRRSEELVRLDPTRDRARQNADHEQQQDRWGP